MKRFALVLHTHLPYLRRNGTWPLGEDFFHQAAVESYLPLIGVLRRLAERGMRDVCTIGVTPVLAEQMHDEHMRAQLEWFFGGIEARAMRQVSNYRGHERDRIVELAGFYARLAREQHATLRSVGDLASGFASLARDGVIELLGGPATHPLLSQMESGALLGMQMRTGLAAHERIFGSAPRGIWAPECAVSPGLEEALSSHGVAYLPVDSAATRTPLRVGDTDVVALPYDAGIVNRVWRGADAYPTGAWYRDFHHFDECAGFKNWRITRPGIGWLGKEIYEPEAAQAAARADAERFVGEIERVEGDLVVAAFDTELFGHWWLEGTSWLEHVMDLLRAHPSIRPVTLREAADGVRDRGEWKASTWGRNADLSSWIAPETDDLWKRLRDAERETESLLAAGATGPAADQMLRELMLLQSSDWPWLIVRDAGADYARRRFDVHYDRWSWLADAIRYGKPAERLVADLHPIDNAPAFPER